MKNTLFIFLLGVLSCGLTACSDKGKEEIEEALTLTLTPLHLDVAKEGGNIQIEVKANVSFDVEIPTAYNSWISLQDTRALTTTHLTFAIARNDTPGMRKGEIIIKSGQLTETITLSQVGKETDGLSYSPQDPDADQPLTITFKASHASALYGYTGDVYIHTGIVDEGVWSHVPAEWNQNIAKCKMEKKEENLWSIAVSPTIRQWFNSGETAVRQLGIVIRSADGSKKGTEDDSFIAITDTKYTGFTPAPIREAPLPQGVEEGINLIDRSTVTLVLYDKDLDGHHKDFAHVTGDFNNWKLTNNANCQMWRDKAAGCWWITLTGLDDSKEYAFQYYVGTQAGETIRLGDAYSEKILDPDNDPFISSATYPDAKVYPTGGKGIVSVFRTTKSNYAWHVPDFKINNPGPLVIYEMHLRDFTSTGALNGAIQKLDYLSSLGINAIELMPVQEFDGNDSWGYNPCYFFALDKAYGTPKMYKEFIDACHRKGIAVIFDVVYNHATGSMPFARLYWDRSANQTAVNNPYFNVQAPHPYSVFHDFNHESPLVRKFVKRNLAFLFNEYKIDGVRFDLTKGFTQQPSKESTASLYDASRIAILKDYHAAIRAVNPNAFVILEHFCESKEEQALAADGMHLWRNLNNAYCQAAMGWSENSSFNSLYERTPAWVGFMESHDEERMGYKQHQWGNGTLKTDLTARMKQLATNTAFFLTVPGPKMIWQFGEVGYDFSINSNEAGTAVDETYRTSRKPIRWDYVEDADRKGLHNMYEKLMKLRNAYPAFFDGKATFSWNVGVADWANGRSLSLETTTGKKLVVVGNFTPIPIEITFPSTSGTWHNYLTGQPETIAKTLSLPANEFALYTNFKDEK